jgi:hypothetical protein
MPLNTHQGLPMPPSAAVIARDKRIFGSYRAGASILVLAIAEEVDPTIVRRALRVLPT